MRETYGFLRLTSRLASPFGQRLYAYLLFISCACLLNFSQLNVDETKYLDLKLFQI